MQDLSRETLLHYVAPCSLFCYTCPAFRAGAIAECAAKLCRYFEGYYVFNDANMPEEYRGWLPEFEAFQNRLKRFATPRCQGCRSNPSPGSGCIEGCVVPACTKEHGVDFCGECSDFPCGRAKDFFSATNDTIVFDWMKGSERIREAGIQKYFEEKKDVSHYISYKK